MFSKVLADDFDPEGLLNPPQAESYLLRFKRGNSLTTSLTQYHPANTLTHKPLLHFEEKLREKKQTRKGERTEGGEGGWQRADKEQWGWVGTV